MPLARTIAAGRAAIDFVFFCVAGVIWPIYMLDAVGEVVLIGLWAIVLFLDRRGIVPGSTIPEIPGRNLTLPIT